VSEGGSGSDQRAAACVGGSRERERDATRGPSSRVPHTNSLTPTLSHTRAASRGPTLRAARNYPTATNYESFCSCLNQSVAPLPARQPQAKGPAKKKQTHLPSTRRQSTDERLPGCTILPSPTRAKFAVDKIAVRPLSSPATSSS
jgi:hypothetical protein